MINYKGFKIDKRKGYSTFGIIKNSYYQYFAWSYETAKMWCDDHEHVEVSNLNNYFPVGA